jgi:DNA-binding beta-propeller fold protein YncE
MGVRFGAGGFAILAAGATLITSCGSTAGPSPSPASPSPTTAAIATTAAPTATPTPTAAGSASGSTAPTPTPQPTLLPPIAENTTSVILTKIPIPPLSGKTASIDLIVIDQEAHRLYAADRVTNGVDVFDITTKETKYLKTVDAGSGANGVVVAKNVNKLFAGLNDSNVAIIDLTSLALIAKVNTGGKGRADELDYDPKDNKIYVANSGDGFVTVIDANTNTIVHKFDNLGAALEQPQYDSADGLMYMTSSDQNAVFVFDPVKDVLVRKDVLAVLCNPQGIAINPKTNQALLGCNIGRAGSTGTSLTVAWDLAKGIFVGVFGQVGSGDSVTYSAKTDRFYFGAHNFPHGSSIGIFSGAPIAFLTNVPTGSFTGAKNLAYDETNNLIYTQDALPGDGALFSFTPPK